MEKNYPLSHTFSENFSRLKYPQVYARYELTMLTLLTARKEPYYIPLLYSEAETAFCKILDNDTAPLFHMNDYLNTIGSVNGRGSRFYVMLFLLEIIKEVPLPAEKSPKSRFTSFILREFTAAYMTDLLNEWNRICSPAPTPGESAEPAPRKPPARKITAQRIRQIQADPPQPEAGSTQPEAKPVPEEASAGMEKHRGDDGLECLVRNVLSEEDLDECMHLKTMLTDLDYKEGHRFDSVVRMLIDGMDRIRREKRTDKKTATMNVNISGSNVNNVGSQITNQQNDRRYGK